MAKLRSLASPSFKGSSDSLLLELVNGVGNGVQVYDMSRYNIEFLWLDQRSKLNYFSFLVLWG